MKKNKHHLDNIYWLLTCCPWRINKNGGGGDGGGGGGGGGGGVVEESVYRQNFFHQKQIKTRYNRI